jgi:hypothetical protein
MRCKYLESPPCKTKAAFLYAGKLGVCEKHKELLEKLIEKKHPLTGDEFVAIRPRVVSQAWAQRDDSKT